MLEVVQRIVLLNDSKNGYLVMVWIVKFVKIWRKPPSKKVLVNIGILHEVKILPSILQFIITFTMHAQLPNRPIAETLEQKQADRPENHH